MLDSATNLGALARLQEVFSREKPVGLVGAGMSIRAGMPSWNKLIRSLEAVIKSDVGEDLKAVIRDEDDLTWRAQEYRRLSVRREFDRFLQDTFGKKPTIGSDDPCRLLVRLPFKHYITTNYDDVLLAAHLETGKDNGPRVLHWTKSADVRSFIYSLREPDAKKSILHLHGHHSRPNSLVLCDTDYIERYVRGSSTVNKLFAVFATERIVFVGFSLSDPDLMAVLKQVNATMRAPDSRHFAVIGIEDPKREVIERRKLRKRFGIDPVFYDSSNDSHDGINLILQALLKANSRDLDDVSDMPPTEPLPPLGPDWNDPQKGRWGGRSKKNGRELTAEVMPLGPDWFQLKLIVRSTNPRQPLVKPVVFHLHQTFVPQVRTIEPSGDTAILELPCYGAFTVGIQADDGKTTLEMDLAKLEDAPSAFRYN